MKLIFAIIPVIASLTAAGQIEFCDTEGCDGWCSFQSPSENGECIQLGGIHSAKATQVDVSCSWARCHAPRDYTQVTIYTDSSCNNGAIAARLEQCIAFGPGLLLYSYDY